MTETPNMSAAQGDRSYFHGKRTWITGHRGMLGAALVRSFENEGAHLLLTSRDELDLCNQTAVLEWMSRNRPEIIFHVAAKVGGIFANATLPAEFLHSNILIQSNVIDAAYQYGVEKLVFVASNCTYPTVTSQPIPESALLTGGLDANIRSYAISKIAGIEMCRAYRAQYGCNFVSIIPPNLYGPGDNYHQQHSHVVAGILRRTHEAKMSGQSELVVWGDGSARRELLHVDDLAEGIKCVAADSRIEDLFNIGCGHDYSITEIASIIAKIVDFDGDIVYDTTKPNGTLKKLLDSTRINSLGWAPKIPIDEGLKSAYKDFLHRLEAPAHDGRI